MLQLLFFQFSFSLFALVLAQGFGSFLLHVAHAQASLFPLVVNIALYTTFPTGLLDLKISLDRLIGLLTLHLRLLESGVGSSVL